MSVIDDALVAMRQRLGEVQREADELRAAIAAVQAVRVGSSRPPSDYRRAASPRRPTTAERAPRGENRRKILDAIMTKAKTAGEIEKETGIATATVSSTLLALVRAGHARKAARGYIASR